MEKDRFSDSKAVLALASTDIAAAGTTDGAWIDTKGFESVVIAVNVDWTVGDISVISFFEADEDAQGDAAAMSDDEALYYPGQLPLGADGNITIGCISKKRYIRLRLTTVGGTVTITTFAMAVLGNSRMKPAAIESSILETNDINAPGVTGDAIVTAPKRTS